MREAPGVRVKAGDLARIGYAGDLGDFDAVVERRRGIVQERVDAGGRVVEVAVLARGAIAVIADRDPRIVHAQKLREDEGRARLARNARNRRVGDCRTEQKPAADIRSLRVESVHLSVIPEIKPDDQPVVVDPWALTTVELAPIG